MLLLLLFAPPVTAITAAVYFFIYLFFLMKIFDNNSGRSGCHFLKFLSRLKIFVFQNINHVGCVFFQQNFRESSLDFTNGAKETVAEHPLRTFLKLHLVHF